MLIRDRFGIKPLYYAANDRRHRVGIGSQVDPEASRRRTETVPDKRRFTR